MQQSGSGTHFLHGILNDNFKVRPTVCYEAVNPCYLSQSTLLQLMFKTIVFKITVIQKLRPRLILLQYCDTFSESNRILNEKNCDCGLFFPAGN